MEKILVTSALPYANGPLHIGHVAGAYLPGDIYVRFQKLIGNDVLFICGTDEYGAPISIKAEAEGVTPRQLVDRYHTSIKESFQGLRIEFDNFSGTARPRHVEIAQQFFLNLLEKGYISQKTTEQWFDPRFERFLADRYVEGICPYCGAEGARGDQCDKCGKLIDALKLIEPRSKISGEIPVIRETTHWYLELPKFEHKLRQWLDTKKYWKDNVLNFILGWLDEGLIERAITRDIDWGVPVPLDNAHGKVLYVWFDAPIGYISSTMEWAERQGQPDKWKDYWLNEKTRLIHFLGKDNIPFHTIIWPSMLMEQKDPFVLPDDVPANEYLNLEGQKMSTSRNWTLWVNDFLQYFDGDLLRYVLAANAPETKDSDFSWKDFQARVNNELNNILGNLANRTFLFARNHFSGKISKPGELREISRKTLSEADNILIQLEESYSGYQVRKATKLFMDLARLGNKYFDETRPWVTIKDNKQEALETLYVCTELLRIISITGFPVIPHSMLKLRKMMSLDCAFNWEDIHHPQNEFLLSDIEPLFSKIDDKAIDYQIELLEKRANINQVTLQHKEHIDFDTFSKLEIRIVRIIRAEKVERSNKLLKLKIDLGGEIRTVVAGIAKSYREDELVGRKVVMVMNLTPRVVMGIKSEAMILAAHYDDELSILVPDNDVPEGSEIS
ncbi:MAG: methionine--tRNA ligase [Candidatus Cloacimonetes bacterium]|nr:methionine--tRNA ligase [Candidatus Cloacimonadota bacterium]